MGLEMRVQRLVLPQAYFQTVTDKDLPYELRLNLPPGNYILVAHAALLNGTLASPGIARCHLSYPAGDTAIPGGPEFPTVTTWPMHTTALDGIIGASETFPVFLSAVTVVGAGSPDIQMFLNIENQAPAGPVEMAPGVDLQLINEYKARFASLMAYRIGAVSAKFE